MLQIRSGSDQKFKVMMNGTQFNAVLPAGNVATYIWDGSIAEVKGNEIPGVLKATDAVNYDKLKVKDDGSGFGNVQDGAWADYLIDVKEAGLYNVSIPHAIGPTSGPSVDS